MFVLMGEISIGPCKNMCVKYNNIDHVDDLSFCFRDLRRMPPRDDAMCLFIYSAVCPIHIFFLLLSSTYKRQIKIISLGRATSHCFDIPVFRHPSVSTVVEISGCRNTGKFENSQCFDNCRNTGLSKERD